MDAKDLWNVDLSAGGAFHIAKPPGAGRNDRWQLVLPDGQRIDMPHTKDDLHGLKAARFIADACNAAARSDTDPVYCVAAADTESGVAYAHHNEPVPQAEFFVLWRSPRGQFAADVIASWAAGEISEGRAAELLGLDRIELRKRRADTMARVTGPLNEQAIQQRRGHLAVLMERIVDERLEQTIRDEARREQIKLSMAGLLADPVYIDALQDWLLLTPIANVTTPPLRLGAADGSK